MTLLPIGQDVQGLVLDGPLLLAGLLALAAGLVSFFSPCCLPLVPGYLGYVAGLAGQDARDQDRTDGARNGVAVAVARRPTRGRTVWGAVLFVAGFAAVFTSYGWLFGSVGAWLIAYQGTLIRVLGVITILVGLVFTGLLWRLPFAGWSSKPGYRPRAGLGGAPLVGVMFGIGWTPCIGPTLAAVLALAATSGGAERGAILSFAYSLGLGVPFLLAAMTVDRGMRTFGWARRNARLIAQSGGAMLVLLGVLQVSGVWTAIISRMQGLITGWEAPL